MIDQHNVPPIDANELLARFIIYSRHIRTSNNTIKPDAFVPHPHNDLSVTRHRDATENELWSVGNQVAQRQDRNLHGRGDVAAEVFLKKDLNVCADPVIGDPTVPDNPNHANVTGWPTNDLGRQRALALEIAAQAQLRRPPDYRKNLPA